ncbi:MAG: hypothetical protein BGO05_20065 [Rhizobiales bacterium 63-7]|nr:DMT family transporter [Hyphomicrobiales bacterium]OJU68429.1 MAG: hypothetical protein BGO05_20065 [Rhizobiales bacterium 63-7]
MDDRKPLDAQAVALMVLACAIWAVQPITLKATADYAAPVMQIGLRSLLAAVCVYALIRFRGGRVVLVGRVALAGAFAGLLFSGEFILVGESLKFTSASHVVVFMYTAPIFAALGLHWKIPSERLAAMQWAGIGLAAFGIGVAFLGRGESVPGADMSQRLMGDALALAAGLCWGMTTVLIRTTVLARVPAAHTLFYQLVVAGIALTMAAAASGQAAVHLAWPLVGNIAFQALVVSFFSFLVWFWLLTKYKASQLGVFSFMTPMMGVVLGVALLGEPLTQEFMLGAAGVLCGIMMVTACPWLRQKAGRSAATRPA